MMPDMKGNQRIERLPFIQGQVGLHMRQEGNTIANRHFYDHCACMSETFIFLREIPK